MDQAETPEGRRDAWAANALGVSALASICEEANLPLVHVSTDYVFDGSLPLGEEYPENYPLAPLSVYGASKAAGEVAAAAWRKHYILRTSWVVGAGKNFVGTMASLAERGIDPSVVADQWGRPTFTQDLAAAALYLLFSGAEYGTYNVSNTGEVINNGPVQADCCRLHPARSPRRIGGLSEAVNTECSLVSPSNSRVLVITCEIGKRLAPNLRGV